MRKMTILAFFMIFTFVFSTVNCFAKEVKGEIIKMDGSRLVVKVIQEGNMSFDITKTTRIFSGGMPAPAKRLLPHTKVRVAGRHGRAEWIFVEEVPK